MILQIAKLNATFIPLTVQEIDGSPSVSKVKNITFNGATLTDLLNGRVLVTVSSAATAAGSTGAIQFNNSNALGADSSNLFWNDGLNILNVQGDINTGNDLIVGGFIKGPGTTNRSVNIQTSGSGKVELFNTNGTGGVLRANNGFFIDATPGVRLNGYLDFINPRLYGTAANQLSISSSYDGNAVPRVIIGTETGYNAFDDGTTPLQIMGGLRTTGNVNLSGSGTLLNIGAANTIQFNDANKYIKHDSGTDALRLAAYQRVQLWSSGNSQAMLDLNTSSGIAAFGSTMNNVTLSGTYKASVPVNTDALYLTDTTNNGSFRFYFTNPIGSAGDLNIASASGGSRLFLNAFQLIVNTSNPARFYGGMQSDFIQQNSGNPVSLRTNNSNVDCVQVQAFQPTKINPYNASTVGLAIIGTATQTANLLEARNNAGTPLTVISNGGNLGIGTTSPARKLHISQAMRLEPLTSSQPSSPVLGDIYVDGDTNTLCFYDGTLWTALGGGSMTCN